MGPVTIAEILRTIVQLAALVQSSKDGATVSREEFNAVVTGRNAALAHLDASIAQEKGA